jgi:hypothetical protein
MPSGKEFGDLGINRVFVNALMFNDLFRDDLVSFSNEYRGVLGVRMIERVSDLAPPAQHHWAVLLRPVAQAANPDKKPATANAMSPRRTFFRSTSIVHRSICPLRQHLPKAKPVLSETARLSTQRSGNSRGSDLPLCQRQVRACIELCDRM